MVQERRRFTWMKEKPAMYDWIQQRVAERRKEKKFLNVLSVEEQEAIRKLNEEQARQAQAQREKLLDNKQQTLP